MTRGRPILLIAYHFPPSAAVGGARMVNFARALADLGWEPHVLTIRERDAVQLDSTRLDGVDRVAIQRARVLPTVASAYRAVRHAWRARLGSSAAPAAAPAEGMDKGSAIAETLPRRVRRYLLSFLLLPDGERGWLFPATLAAVRSVRRHRIPWILTSCPPYSTHLIGLAVKTLTGARWVADFRDPWMTTGSKRLYPTSAASRTIEAWLERTVVGRADLALFNVERLRDAYRNRYQNMSPAKFTFIPNAVVPEKAPADTAAAKYDVFTLAYTGSLYVGRSPEPVFRAVSRLVECGRIDPADIRIRLVGDCHDVDGVPTGVLAAKYGLESVVEVCGQVPHREALGIVRRSHVALLLAPNLAYQIPAKAYEYLAVGTPILAIAGDGGTADLIRESGGGRVFRPEDVEPMAEFIAQEIREARSRHRRPGARPCLSRYDARRLTEELLVRLRQAEAPAAAAGRQA